MKNLKKISTIILFLFISSSIMAGNKFVKIKTSAICGMCKNRIELSMNNLDGIKKAVLDVKTKYLRVKYDDKIVSLETIKATISNEGYNADEVLKNPEAYNVLPNCCKLESSCDINRK